MTRTTPLTSLFRVTVDLEADRVRLRVTGDVGSAAAPVLAGVLHGVTGVGHLPVDLDLAGVRWLDPAVLRAIMLAVGRARQGGGELVIRSGDPIVARNLARLGVTPLAETGPSVAASARRAGV